MAWKIELSSRAERSLDKFDPQITRRILTFLFERVAHLDDLRSMGEALQGSRLGDFWRYRVGDYRIICRMEDTRLVVMVVSIGHRRDVYR